MKRFIFVGMFMVVFMGVANAATLTDVKEADWYSRNVYRLVDMGVVAGYPDGTFRPKETVQADQFVKMVLIGMGNKDIKNGATYWASEYVAKAKELGLLTEADFATTNGLHDYTRSITREQMSMIIDRATKAGEAQLVNTAEDTALYATLMYDYARIKAEIKPSVVEVYAKGILAGYPDGSFKPTKSLTRAEATTVILRLLDKAERVRVNKPLPIDPIFKDTSKYINDYFDVVGNELRFKERDGSLKDYRLKEDYIPELNKKVYDCFVSLLQEPAGKYSVGANYRAGNGAFLHPLATVRLGGMSMYNGGYNFAYVFYEDAINNYNPKEDWQYDKFATSCFLSLDIIDLYGYNVIAKDVNYLQYEYAVKLKNSLNAILGVDTGTKVNAYVMEKYDYIHVKGNKSKLIRESKYIDNIRIDFINGYEKPYNRMKFFFSYAQ